MKNSNHPQVAYLMDMLTYCRPDRSETEAQFIKKYLLTLPNATQDLFGNVHVDTRTNDTHRTLFVAHTDTVHHQSGFQRVKFDTRTQTISTLGQCLGADDAAGMLVLMHLIRSNVPAYYVFTRGEERGGKGAKYLAQNHFELLAQFDRAIAFDRKGTSSVITHQGWGRCCSDAFADALSDGLTTDALMYGPDDGGVYTDTAEFVDIIAECTNVSVGYFNEHTKHETLDVFHLFALMARAVEIDWDGLPVAREPDGYEEDEDAYLYGLDPLSDLYDVDSMSDAQGLVQLPDGRMVPWYMAPVGGKQ
jgi:hypothetical protein